MKTNKVKPMISFGQFLVEQGLVTDKQHQEVLQVQNKNRLLGEIALETGYLSAGDIPVIMEFMEKNPEVMFGEAAISLGLFNMNQLRYLLDIRTKRKIRIGDLLLHKGFISEENLRLAVMNFNKKKKKLEKILIVDSSSLILSILSTMLQKYDYKVSTAKSCKSAFPMIQEERPDVLIISGILPDMTGFDFCQQIIADPANASLSVVIMSTDTRTENIQKGFEVGVNHFLAKPIQENELINVIYQIEREVSKEKREKILVVDDTTGIRTLIAKELSRAGFEIHQAVNGKEGVEKAIKLLPEIITMDLEMPVMGGFEACRLLKENPHTADIPVIIVSSRCTPDMVAKGFDAGAIEFFAKPFKSGRLAEYINILLESKKIKKKERILIVEDSATTRHIIQYLFSKNGFEVFLAHDAETALALLPDCQPDLILTDCYMPGMSGFEMVREIKKTPEYRHLPVIMVTAAQKREDLLQGLAVGANDYIIKPFDESELIARAGVHLLNKKLYDEIIHQKNKLEMLYDNKNRLLQEITILDDMSQGLQNCMAEHEAYPIIVHALNDLFLCSSGALLICDENEENCQSIANWGEVPDSFFNDIQVTSCHALSTKKVFNSLSEEKDNNAQHCDAIHDKETICIPLVSREIRLGLIRLRLDNVDRRRALASTQNHQWHLMRTSAEHISLALANLRLRESLRAQSIRDPLTNLYNRRYMEESLFREISRMKRNKSSLGVIMLDVDYFKNLNDTYGHTAGDEVLKKLAALLANSTRNADIACRYGGEEFILILPDACLNSTAAKAEHIRLKIEKELHMDFDNRKASVTVSLGVSVYPENGVLTHDLISQADKALYAAKRSGRNRVTVAKSLIV